jgi:hypothetical protein
VEYHFKTLDIQIMIFVPLVKNTQIVLVMSTYLITNPEKKKTMFQNLTLVKSAERIYLHQNLIGIH